MCHLLTTAEFITSCSSAAATMMRTRVTVISPTWNPIGFKNATDGQQTRTRSRFGRGANAPSHTSSIPKFSLSSIMMDIDYMEATMFRYEWQLFSTHVHYQQPRHFSYQIKRYFVSFWNGVDLRYRLLKGPKIRISIAGIIISRVSTLMCHLKATHMWQKG